MSTVCDFVSDHLDLSAVPSGTSRNIALRAAYEADGQELRLPVTVIRGKQEGPTITLIGCLHGIEVVTIEIAHQLRTMLSAAEISGTLILAPLVNPLAYRASSRFTPVDAQDMNRVFPGDRGTTITHLLAAYVCRELLSVSDMVIDCHSDNPPSLHFTIVGRTADSEMQRKCVEMAKAFGYPYVFAPGGSGTITDYCVSRGIPAITPEFAFSRRADTLSVRTGVRGVCNVLSAFGMLSRPAEAQSEILRFPDGLEYSVLSAKRGGGLIVLDKVPGDALRAGDIVAHVRDLWGTVVEELRTPWDGYLIANPMQGNQMACSGEKIAYIAH